MALRQIKFWLVASVAASQIAWAYDRKEGGNFASRALACEHIEREAHNPLRFEDAVHCLAPLVDQAKYDTTKAELSYRRAELLERDERFAEARALFLSLAHNYPREMIAARARFRAARLLEDALGDAPAALAEYKLLIREAPDNVAAVNALSHAEQLIPAGEVTYFLSTELEARPRSALALSLMQRLATRLEKNPDSARVAAELFDRLSEAQREPARITSTYLAARAWLAAGDVAAAMARLRIVMGSLVSSILPGDTNSASLDDAAFLFAEIYRDRLHDPLHAREAFERVLHDYPTSRLVDDALYALEALAIEQGDPALARKWYARLQHDRPSSRYARAAYAPR